MSVVESVPKSRPKRNKVAPNGFLEEKPSNSYFISKFKTLQYVLIFVICTIGLIIQGKRHYK